MGLLTFGINVTNSHHIADDLPTGVQKLKDATTERVLLGSGTLADQDRRLPASNTSRQMRPRELVELWVKAFNSGDADALAAFYTEDAVNHQVAETPVSGRTAIREMFASGFASAKMVCIVEQILEDGEWAILEWKDPLGLRGCGFFQIIGGKIVFQRGYWDKLSFLRQQGLPLPKQ